jgi:hypothetical protein
MKAVRAALCAIAALSQAVSAQLPRAVDWRSTFDVDVRELVSAGASPYFILDPGFELVLEERETKAGKLVEVSRNFFARHSATGDVYYFGEEVDVHKGGKVASHDGAWLSGSQGVTPGGTFERCVRFEETTPLESGVKDYKLFAPGIGMVQDASLKLIRYGRR